MLQSLGKISVPTPGTPVQVYSASKSLLCNSILIETWPTNTGKLYIGVSSSMNAATGVGVVAIVPAPTGGILFSWSATIPYAPGGVDAAQLWIDVDNGGDAGLVSVAVT